MKMRLAAGAAVALTAFGAGAEVKVSALFGPHMVLPRDCEIPVWGKADPGEKVKVEFAGKSAETTADKKGAWAVKLPPLEGSREGRELVIGGNRFSDVLVGDVFLYAGGNEAEAMYRMPSLFSKTDWGRKMDVAAEVKSCEGLTDIRLYRDKAGSMIPVTEFPSTEKWRSIKDFKESAPIVARHFGEAWMARTGVPCGFINVSFYYRTFIEFIMPDAFEYCRGGAEYKDPKEFYDSYLRLLRGLADFGGRVGAVTGATDDTTFASDDIIDIKMRFGAAAYGAVIAAMRFPIRAAVWVDPGNPGYFSKAEYEDVLKSMFSGWRAHSPRDFKVTVIPRKGARRAVCDKAVAELLDGSAPEPLKKVFELKDPASLAPSWGGGFAVSKIFGDHMVLQ